MSVIQDSVLGTGVSTQSQTNLFVFCSGDLTWSLLSGYVPLTSQNLPHYTLFLVYFAANFNGAHLKIFLLFLLVLMLLFLKGLADLLMMLLQTKAAAIQ